MKRVFHPTLSAWEDVPDGDVEAWAAAGWRKTQPKHVDLTDAPPVGEHPGIASVPVEPPTATSGETAGSETTT